MKKKQFIKTAIIAWLSYKAGQNPMIREKVDGVTGEAVNYLKKILSKYSA